MKEIECPKCHTTFQVDDSTYESIVAQVKNKEFKEELRARIAEAEQKFRSQEESNRLQAERAYEKELSRSKEELSDLKNEITRLKGVIASYDATKTAEISQIKSEKAQELNDAIAEKERRIAELNVQIGHKDSELKLKLLEAKSAGEVILQKKEQELTELRAEMKSDKLSAEKREAELRDYHKQQLADKEAEIDRLKDFKLRLSTKMVGETLEQHCATVFDSVRSFGAFPYATFEKDNTAVDHSKGDFIFRDYIDGNEYVSIMFEMKNEMDATATKHKNSDFFDKLDKDRKRKGCEYAVLVSMLELGNDLYDAGIRDVSPDYQKMLVIRPQFFLPVLRLIAEAAKKGYMERIALMQELEVARSQTRDFTTFEKRINDFRDTFSKNVIAANKKFESAIEGIDKTIEGLEKQIEGLKKVKANFEEAEKKLLKADEYVDGSLTVKKLTHGAPSVKKMIEEAGKENKE